MNKTIGLCVLVIGGLLFLQTVYVLLNNLTTTREEYIKEARILADKEGISSSLSQEQLEKIVDESRKHEVTAPITAMFISAGIAFAGFLLYKRGIKDKKLHEYFKFD